jgi:hypothetical protein
MCIVTVTKLQLCLVRHLQALDTFGNTESNGITDVMYR